MTTTHGSTTAGTPRALPPAEVNPHHSRRWLILAVIALAQLIVVLDVTIVNIALPSAQESLGFSTDNRQWVVTAYALAFGSLLLLGGKLGDLIGRKPLYIIGLVGFATASALGGAAGSFEVLVVARTLQGVFAAMLAPAALSLLTTSFTDPAERGRAFAIYGAVAGTGGAVGLLLGGALTEFLSWRWCMYVNVPLAAIAAVGGAILLKRQTRAGQAVHFDILGAVVVVVGLVSLVYGLGEAEAKGWTSPVTLGFVGLGAVLLAVFAWIETRVDHPLLPLRIALDRTRGGSFLALGILGAGMFGVFLFLTYYLSTILGYSPLTTGIAYMPMSICLIIGTQLAAPVVTRVGYKVPMALGFVVAAVGMYRFTSLDLTSGYVADIMPGLIIVGLGLGFVIAPAFSSAVAGVEPADAGVASAAVNTFQQIGGSIGTALLSAFAASAATAFLVGREPNEANMTLSAVQSYTTAFGWSAVFFVVGAVVCAVLLPHGAVKRDPEAAPLVSH